MSMNNKPIDLTQEIELRKQQMQMLAGEIRLLEQMQQGGFTLYAPTPAPAPEQPAQEPIVLTPAE